MRRAILVVVLLLLAAATAATAQQYKVTGQIPLKGEAGWDYLLADSSSRRLYVTAGTEVEVLDLDSEKMIAEISGMKHLHGVAVADDLGRGFISDGGEDTVVIFDLKSNAVLQKVKAGKNPDAILFDPATRKVFAFNGHSSDVTAIDAATGNVLATVPLGGKPEFAVSDGKGNVYVNIEDKSELVKLDPQAVKVAARWSLAPCKEPSGLAIDAAARRLFSVCDNQKMAITDADSGKVVTTVTIGEGPDAAGFDSGKKLAFSSNGEDGTLTVVKGEGSDKYSVVANVKTEKSARTMALDEKTHKLYLTAAQFGPAPAPSPENPRGRPKILPGTFHLVVVSPQ